MNDPHVVALFYSIGHGRSVDYREAKPLDHEEEEFSIHIVDGTVRFTMKAHYATEEAAQEAVREYIERWEFDVALREGPDTFKLKLDRAQIEDRRPSPGMASGSVSATVPAPEVRVRATSLIQYPPSPPELTITPDVQSMHDRLMDYRLGKEPLPSMAYFCLTVLEESTGAANNKRSLAAKKYGIEKAVLDEIGKLSTKKGGPQARKAPGTAHDLTSSETCFLEKAIKVLIRRAAEVGYDPHKSRGEIKLAGFAP